MTRSVDKLQGLHDELDLANAAASEFHVAFQLVAPTMSRSMRRLILAISSSKSGDALLG